MSDSTIFVMQFNEVVETGGSGGSVDLTGYATEKWVQNNYQPKGDYLTEIPDEQLAQAVEDYMAEHPIEVPDSGGNVAYDEAQELTDEQQAQARENIGAQPAGNYLTEVPEGYAKTEDVPTDEEIIQLIKDNAPEPVGGNDLGIAGATVGQTVKISAVDENGVPTAWEPVEFPSGGSSETAAELVLASGTIASGTEAKTYIDTGVTFEMLKQYKRFLVIFDGASNVAANNVYLKFTPNIEISRISTGGWACGYEWVNKDTNLLRLYGYFSGNPSTVWTDVNYISARVPNLFTTSIAGAGGIWLSDLSDVSDADTLKIYLSDKTTIDYTWAVRGLTV